MNTVYLNLSLFFLNIGLMLLNVSSDNPKVALFNSFVAGWCVAIAVVRYLQVTNNI